MEIDYNDVINDLQRSNLEEILCCISAMTVTQQRIRMSEWWVARDGVRQGWVDFSRVRATSNFLRRCGLPGGVGVLNDEAHFWLNGYGNKQNCRIWSEANPQVYVETPLHPEKLTVWCALWAGGILLQKR
ncbi:hypothetical protein TNCV_347331 [Trichonephila clavipes]|nr:hypothetical protein TNCV_347331 [Trichonephila clavipes]